MEIKEQISKQFQQILLDLGVSDLPITLEKPASQEHGDYSSNIALVLAKKLGKTPFEFAQEIANKFDEVKSSEIEKVEAIKPGFINFFLSQDYLISQVKKLIEERIIVTSGTFKNKKIMIEFTDPNPFKEFHIGHLYTNIIGESLARLLSAVGAQVKRANYQGDVGLHVAKALYGVRYKFENEGLQFDQLEKKTLEDRAKFLGQAYALGATAFEEDEKAKEQIIIINKQVYAKDPEVWELYQKGRAWSLDYFELIYQRLGTKFDYYYFESQVGEYGLELVKEYLAKGIFAESQGAVIFPGEKYGLHSRVFINSLGLPTYEAKELGLAPLKYQDFAYDQSIIVTGNEINEYFKVLIKALEQIKPDLAEKTKHLSHGMVRLPEGKMSSRTGKVLSGEGMLDEAKAQSLQLLEQTNQQGEVSIDNEKTAEAVGIAAVKWALLRSSVGKDIEFSFKESISFDGNSGPYLQYTAVRCQSVLTKAQKAGYDILNIKFDIDGELAVEESQLLRLLAQYPEIVVYTAENFAPHILTTYLFEVAQYYNLFYQKLPILQEGDKKQLRLFLTRATGQVITLGLQLLGISVPERM